MQNIEYTNDENISVSSNNDIFDIQFYKDKEYFRNIENYVKFIKSCESRVRNSDDYDKYVATMKSIGLDRCQILGNIHPEEGDMTKVEMHHGPLLTLFDYCAIVLDYLLNTNQKVNTFIVADIVLQEHFNGNIQTVMLAVTPHQLIDSGKIFINFNQATGNLNNFLIKYKEGLNPEQINKINRYIDMCEKMDTTDNGLLDIKNTISKWTYNPEKNEIYGKL